VIRSVEVVIHSEAAQPVIHSQVVEVSRNLKGVGFSNKKFRYDPFKR